MDNVEKVEQIVKQAIKNAHFDIARIEGITGKDMTKGLLLGLISWIRAAVIAPFDKEPYEIKKELATAFARQYMEIVVQDVIESIEMMRNDLS